MSIMELLVVVFPHLAAVRVERVYHMGATVRVKAATTKPNAQPADASRCGFIAAIERFLSDLSVAGQEVLLQVRVRRFFCDNIACDKRTFAEQVAGLTSRYGRRAEGLPAMLRTVAPTLGDRPGTRHTARLACAAGRSTLLRLLQSMPDPQVATPRALGVDEFAWRKGHTCGDLTHRHRLGAASFSAGSRDHATHRRTPRPHPSIDFIRHRRGALSSLATYEAPVRLRAERESRKSGGRDRRRPVPPGR